MIWFCLQGGNAYQKEEDKLLWASTERLVLLDLKAFLDDEAQKQRLRAWLASAEGITLDALEICMDRELTVTEKCTPCRQRLSSVRLSVPSADMLKRKRWTAPAGASGAGKICGGAPSSSGMICAAGGEGRGEGRSVRLSSAARCILLFFSSRSLLIEKKK
jgi:hypothetical protein